MTKRTFTMSKVQRQHGFTFVELMLVIVILAMTASISGLYFVNVYKMAALRNITRKLTLMGKYARMYAIENAQSCWIHLNQEQKRFYLAVLDDESDEETPESTVISNSYCRRAVLKEGIEFELVRIAPITEGDEVLLESDHSIYFYPDGTCDAAVIQIGNGRHSMTAVFSSAYTKIYLYEGTADTIEDRMQVVDLDVMD